MTTYRERREARAERLREWADKREAKAATAYDQATNMASVIPFGQPVLTDHYSYRRDVNYRNRIGATYDRAHEHATKAADMNRRADNIEAAAAHAIYNDDPDAIERLTARIASLEAERDRIKAYNASCRKGTPDVSLLAEHELSALRFSPAAYQERRKGQLPPYVLSNLSSDIKRNRDRLAQLSR